MMAITCNYNNQQLFFDETMTPFLHDQLHKDACLQARIRLVFITVSLILIAAGAVTTGLAFAVVIPYGLLHTCAIVAGATAFSFGSMSLAAFCVESTKKELTSFITNHPSYHSLRAQLNSSRVQNITCEKSWRYLTKLHKEFKERSKLIREILDQNIGSSTSTFDPLIDICLEY